MNAAYSQLSATNLPRSVPNSAQGRAALGRAWPSLHRIIFLGRLLLIGQMLAPVFLVGRSLFGADKLIDVAWLALCCWLSVLWNVYFFEQVLCNLPLIERAQTLLSPTRKLLILGGQLAFALACHYVGREGSIEGSKQYLWIPLAVFIPLTTRRTSLLSTGVILPIILATLFEWCLHDGPSAFLWAVVHCSVTGFILICLLGVREFGKMGSFVSQVASELAIANQVQERQSHQVVQLAIADERNRLARDIHDALGHSLTVVTAQLDAASELLQHDISRAQLAITKAQKASRDGLEEVRRSVRAMRSNTLENRDLVEALSLLVSTFERPNLDITLNLLGVLPHLSGKQEEGLFRCAQEAVTNAIRHAQANKICLEIDFHQTDLARLQVRDNGCGFASDAMEGNGITGLRERALLLHGTLNYGTSSDGGVTCEFKFPIS
jgi:signal transduction histidine kinase